MVCILPEAEILLIDNILPVLDILHYYYNLFDYYSLDHILFVLPDPCQNRFGRNLIPALILLHSTGKNLRRSHSLHHSYCISLRFPPHLFFYKNIIFFIEILSQSLILCNNVPKINHIIQQCHTDCKPEKSKYIFYSMLFYISHPQ